MFRKCKLIGLLASIILVTGCTTPTKMALSNDSETVSKTGKPIFLMSATLRNTYKTSYQPKLLFVNVERPIAKDSADQINFALDDGDKGKFESDSPNDGNSYLLRMQLEQGEYVIQGLTAHANSFPIFGSFFAPIHATIKSSEPGVYYLGHIDATVRERKGNEFKAGPSIPLLDQAASGASGGTFDIEISDQWEKDESKYQDKFPALKGVAVQKAILPPFDRANAQQWWEAH